MRIVRTLFLLLSAAACLCGLAAIAQDSQSLGDAARQARQQRQQKDTEANKNTPPKDAQSQDATSKDSAVNDTPAAAQPPKGPKKVITNDEIPEHVGPTRPTSGSQNPGVTYPQPNYGDGKVPAEYWKAQIQALQNSITSTESQIKSLTESIQYAGANCVANCVQWNERQKQKQDQVEVLKSQLELQQKRLEEMQEMARKQGYGSAVYDP